MNMFIIIIILITNLIIIVTILIMIIIHTIPMIERAMAEIFTPATLAEWLSGCSSHSGRVAEWVSGSSSHSARVAEWLLQPLCQSGLSAWVPATLAEWLLQQLWESGWVAAPATLAEWLSGSSSHSGRAAEWLWQSHQPMKWITFLNVFKHFNIQARLYDIDSNLIYKHNLVNSNCHSYITFNVLRTATYTLWTITWNHLKGKIVLMNPTSSGLETTITSTTEKNLLNTKCLMVSMMWWV